MHLTRQKANELIKKCEFKVLNNQIFEYSQPFPSLLKMTLAYYHANHPSAVGVDSEVYTTLTRDYIAASPEFYSRFLVKTTTLREINLISKPIFCTELRQQGSTLFLQAFQTL